MIDYHFEEREQAKPLWPRGFIGTTKLGNPLFVDKVGSHKIKELLE